MLALSKATLRRVKRRDKAARWVVTLGGMAVIASVIAIVVLIVGTVLPLFQGAGTRLIAALPLPASIAPRDVLAVGVEIGVDEKKLLVAHLLGRDGTFTFLDLHTGAILKQATTRGEKASRAEAASPSPSIEAVERTGAGEYSLVWSDGTMALVEATVAADPKDAHGKPVCTVRTRATIPPEKGPRPLRAIVRASKDNEGTVTCPRCLPNNRIRVIRQVREENLAGDVTMKTERTVLPNETVRTIGPLALDGAGKNLYAGTSDGLLLWWRLDDDGRPAAYAVTTAFHDQRAVTALGLLLGDVSLAVGDARGSCLPGSTSAPAPASRGSFAPSTRLRRMPTRFARSCRHGGARPCSASIAAARRRWIT